MTIEVFGHLAPDTDSTGSPILWAWYLQEIQGTPAKAKLLGTPNTEAAFVLSEWNVATPPVIETLEAGTPVVIVDTNNPDELPPNINACDIRAIIDHHKLVGGLKTDGPIDITIRPLACTATVMIDLMGADRAKLTDQMKGVALSCILSDTLAFRSPTTTPRDEEVARELARDLGLDIAQYAARMFEAKSDISAFGAAELIRMDSKVYPVGDVKCRVSVLETTAPHLVLSRKEEIMNEMPRVSTEDDVDQVLLFVVDILREEATLLIPNDTVAAMATRAFSAQINDDTTVLPGVMSRKKQILPALSA